MLNKKHNGMEKHLPKAAFISYHDHRVQLTGYRSDFLPPDN